MPLVRLIIFLFRGVGRIFAAIGRFLKALVGAGMRGFLLKFFEASLRLGFIASLVAVVVVCAQLLDLKYYQYGGHEGVGPMFTYKFDTYNNYGYRAVTLDDLLTQFTPKDPKVAYGPGKLDVEGVVLAWKQNEMVHVSRQAVKWDWSLSPKSEESNRPVLEPEDFAPRSWRRFVHFFEQAWAIFSLPLVVAWLVFPSGASLLGRVRRACLMAPVVAVVSFSFAYLLTRYWLSVQYEAIAELVVDLPRWVHPVDVLNKSILAGVVIGFIPMVAWYLLRWVLGPFFKPKTGLPSP
jgi:hypothetical protein